MSDTIVVVGSGVVGLACALKIQERFPALQVKIIAPTFATDPQSIEYTSSWAGAHLVPVVNDGLQKRALEALPDREPLSVLTGFEEDSFREFWKLAQDDPNAPVMIADQTQLYDEIPGPGLGADLLKLYMPEVRR
jgi:glycine/D-amino acid oxidase-like deaminating enzyme